jgi:hypothetical protein
MNGFYEARVLLACEAELAGRTYRIAMAAVGESPLGAAGEEFTEEVAPSSAPLFATPTRRELRFHRAAIHISLDVPATDNKLSSPSGSVNE